MERTMPTKFKILAILAALAAGTSGTAMAQYACAPGYTYINGVCQPVRAPGYGNPVSGTVSGEAAGAAVVGGALRACSGSVTGTANVLAPPPFGCNAGYTYYNGACVRAR